jgi:hypothetical protein
MRTRSARHPRGGHWPIVLDLRANRSAREAPSRFRSWSRRGGRPQTIHASAPTSSERQRGTCAVKAPRPPRWCNKPFGMFPRSWLSQRLSLLELRIAAALTTYANKAGRCRVKHETLALDTGMAIRHVVLAMSGLVKKRILVAKRGPRASTYQLIETGQNQSHLRSDRICPRSQDRISPSSPDRIGPIYITDPINIPLQQTDVDVAFNELRNLGITKEKAEQLCRAYPDRIRPQLDALPDRKRVDDPAGYIIRAIERDCPLPRPGRNSNLIPVVN